ncbi:PD-(D/E)XK nuclease family protein [Salinimicrobium flavum]|uniref:PD-(D/E)XK nuclease family protein n=1 Tax=Salinimicrobium flavum TaxID=1737065 RepID=A0ABW5IVZ9_9FLAO
MIPFLTQTLKELLSRDIPISEYTFILPGKRAGSYLVHELGNLTGAPVFSPKILSIEDFAQEVAGLKSVDNITALFEFYSAYVTCTPKEEVENFDTFSSWAQTLLYDFNEIDRYLIDPDPFFGYLANIQEMSHWYLQEERTPLMENYLSFWNKLPVYYQQLKKQLQEKDMAYQGMVYRRASEKIDEYIQNNTSLHIFAGFNALNNAEQEIFQQMLRAGAAEVFWDIDEVFLKDEQHDVSLFMRQYLKNWPFYRDKEFRTVSLDFSKKKEIEIIGIPKNIGQAKFVGEILAKLPPEEVRNTAVVLGDESLLLPVLNSLPPNIVEVNVTMGFSLKNAPVAFLFEDLLKMHSTGKDDWYYKDLLSISNHPLLLRITGGASGLLSEEIRKQNLVYVSSDFILNLAPEKSRKIHELCFTSWGEKPGEAITRIRQLIYEIKQGLDPGKDKLTLEFLYQFHILINKLNNLLLEYTHITSLKTLFSIYKDLVSGQSVDFRGKPFTGLQVMGMLESRVLDFKNVILLSVNEGVLPAGKSSNSFIPYDLKCAYNLPTYKEKDAVYAYHFYHLMQRAENLRLLYNTETDGLNAGEKSRFLLQLEIEPLVNHRISAYTVAPEVPAIQNDLKIVKKNKDIMNRIRELAQRGFSPSALTTYIRNPLDFYKQYILNIREREEVEETVAFNTLGTVVHDTLEEFYMAWENRELTVDKLEAAIKATPQEIEKQFREHYSSGPLNRGKNLLIFEVAKRYVINFLKSEIKTLKEGNSIKIMQVENKLNSGFSIAALDFPVNLKGTVDRVDEFNGKLRIIDYKTGKVDQNKVEIVDWEDISSDYDKYSKPFQILMYACLLDAQNPITESVEAGIISFKNLQNGFLKFSKKDKNGRGAVKDQDITRETLSAFKEQLEKLILEICDPNIPFTEKEIKQKSW